MSVLRDPGTFHDDGGRDARRHHERLRKQIAERLRTQIGDEQLITAGPEQRIKVHVTGQRDWRFIFDRSRGGGVGHETGESGEAPSGSGERPGAGPGDGEAGSETYEVVLDMVEVEQHLFEQLGLPRLVRKARELEDAGSIAWDDRARKGPLLDRRATLRNNFRRNAASGRAGLGNIDPEDVRFLTYRDDQRPNSKAVVFLLLDVSGSMGGFEKRVARLFFWWATRFLRHRYRCVDLVFIAHHDTARVCTEEEFFTRVESGGTRCSSAYRLVLDIQQARYPTSEWNVFVAHCSDGDNHRDDNAALLDAVRQTAAIANLVGFVQIDRAQRYAWGGDHVGDVLSEARIDGLVTAEVTDDDEIWAALRTIFQPDPAELGP